MIREGEEHTMTREVKRRKLDSGGVSLPEDIVFDVLARLPAKTLCRFRCVSKGWRALISDQAFIAAQRSRADPLLVGVFLGARSPLEVRVMGMDGDVVRVFAITTSTPPPSHWPSSRRDLICVDGNGLSRHGGGMVIDPAAGRACTVLGMGYPAPSALRCDTRFGRATPSGAFKVLSLQHPFRMDGDVIDHHQLCEVATIMDGVGGGTEPPTWRRTSAPPFVTAFLYEHQAVVNGVVYFMHYELQTDADVNEDGDIAPSWNRIAAFDLESEEWKAEAIDGPALGLMKERETWSISLVELKGTLAMVQDIYVDNDQHANIWRLLDPDKSIWVKECTIQMPKCMIEPTKPLGALVDGRILLLVRHEEETRQSKDCYQYQSRDIVLFYNPSTDAFTDSIDLAEKHRDILVFYSGSLLS